MDNLQNIAALLAVVFYWLFSAAVTIRVITRRRPVSGTLAWLMVIYVIPLIGAVLYLMIGELNLGRRHAKRTRAMIDPYLHTISHRFGGSEAALPGGPLAQGIHQLLIARNGVSALGYSAMQLLDTPEAIFEQWLRDIEQATDSIRIETYIWHPGGRVDDITEALIAASHRGVKVSLLIDHAGSRRFFRSHWRKKMVTAGIQVVPALPVKLMRALAQRIDLRLHRKLLIFDDRIAYTGSMNMADPVSFKRGAGVGQWIDIMLRLDGQAAPGLSKVFAWDWEVETSQRELPEYYPADTQWANWVSVIPSGPGVGEDLIGQAVLSVIYRANKSITICTPYFVPSEAIFEALCQAAKRGVDVNVLLPKHNDSMMVGWASRSYFELLLESGAKIHRFDGGLLHSKVMLIDEEVALVGSVNLDIRSLQLNFELTIALFDGDSSTRIGRLLNSYLRQSEMLTLPCWRERSRGARVLERSMFFMSPLL
ncbi:MAG: cardiolipin synthase [Halopseudomonas sp.]|jgi:cardiolipin synthase|uniref:cardiolipin synthase n=1 Tax=Halopseudomonas sp. TaxID=2901191 RepID=UPI0039E30757